MGNHEYTKYPLSVFRCLIIPQELSKKRPQEKRSPSAGPRQAQRQVTATRLVSRRTAWLPPVAHLSRPLQLVPVPVGRLPCLRLRRIHPLPILSATCQWPAALNLIWSPPRSGRTPRSTAGSCPTASGMEGRVSQFT